MADISDVLNVLATQIASTVYPNGTSHPSVSGSGIRVESGWPVPDQLDTDLAAGIAHVSIFPAGPDKNTTRYQPKALVMSVNAPTLTLTQSGLQITVGGAMPSPFAAQNLAAIINNQAFIYPIQATDTLTSCATGLASLIAASYPGASSSGPVITVPAGAIPSAVRVGTVGNVATEWERQEQRIQITVWAPTPAIRNAIGAAIKSAFAQIAFLTMPDGFGARVLASGNSLMDSLQKAQIFRRDLFYSVEYATTISATAATVVAHQTQIDNTTAQTLVTLTN